MAKIYNREQKSTSDEVSKEANEDINFFHDFNKRCIQLQESTILNQP